MKTAFVYILASKKNGTLYTGVTSDLVKRVANHKMRETEGFSSKYEVYILVYYECHDDLREAIMREKRIKRWRRSWKLELIEKSNPNWRDLYDDIVG
ncbi:MAG: GIY-YIG nuclease family protein [Candidatus Zixiibacteriota bacterium]|nr:MAG: GIY-YIG nuclease family protein [candidate division Zixibacteria bacterium]